MRSFQPVFLSVKCTPIWAAERSNPNYFGVPSHIVEEERQFHGCIVWIFISSRVHWWLWFDVESQVYCIPFLYLAMNCASNFWKHHVGNLLRNVELLNKMNQTCGVVVLDIGAALLNSIYRYVLTSTFSLPLFVLANWPKWPITI